MILNIVRLDVALSVVNAQNFEAISISLSAEGKASARHVDMRGYMMHWNARMIETKFYT